MLPDAVYVTIDANRNNDKWKHCGVPTIDLNNPIESVVTVVKPPVSGSTDTRPTSTEAGAYANHIHTTREFTRSNISRGH